MIDNKAKRALAAGKPVMALQLNFPHSDLAEYLVRLGFDCLMMECEHGGFTDAQLQDVARACELTGAALMVHVPLDSVVLQRYLSMGVSGFHIPQIHSTEQSRAALDAIKFTPDGNRGTGIFRTREYDLSREPWPAYMKRANAETLVAMSIEDPKGIAAVPEIAKLPGIDIIHIGQGDLSASMGLAGQTKHASVEKLTDQAIAATLAAGKIAGLAASTPDDIRIAYKRGARFILTPIVRAIPIGTNALLETMRELAGA
jgi:4-hydroxy-2-oxoheptanedioate aldolase